jgi:hypothetical protein
MKKTATRPVTRALAKQKTLRRKAAAWRRKALSGLAGTLLAAGAFGVADVAHAQMGQTAMDPSGGIVNRAVNAFSNRNLYGPGYFYYGINAADRGLGYNGSYMTLGGYIPYAEDNAGGFWSADLRSHLSEYGGFFSNVGVVRKQFIGGTLLGVGVYWDYDGDLNQYPTGGALGTEPYGQFGHVYNQVGVSGEWLTDWGNLRSNGYMPVGSTAYTVGAPGQKYYQTSMLCAYGLDAALGGADLEVGAYIPALAQWAGMWSVGGYALGNVTNEWSGGTNAGEGVVPWFGGVYTRVDMTFLENWDFSLQYNNDSFFDSTGFARLTYRMGGSRRRTVPDQLEQPMMRNEHIVRAHRTPEVVLNPDNANQPWRVIHVDNTATAGGDGTYENPFNTLAAADAVAFSPWDVVFVNRGDGTSSGYDTQFSFNAPNQFLVGNGSSFYVNTANCGLFDMATDFSGTRPLLTNPAGASVFINGAVAPGAVVQNFFITGSGTGIYASGNLSSGLARSGVAAPITTASATGDTVINRVTVSSTGPNQTGIFLNGDPSLVTSATNLDGQITFYDTAVSGSTDYGMIVTGPSNATFRADYNGSIESSRADKIVLVQNMSGGTVDIAQGNPPAGSFVPNQVHAGGGGGVEILSNSANTTINIDNVSLLNNSLDSVLVRNDNSTTRINAGSGQGISRAAAGSAIAIQGGAPKFTYTGPITNARATPTGGSSYLLSVDSIAATSDIQLVSPLATPFSDTGDGIFVQRATGGAQVSVFGANIASAGAQGVLVNDSSGTLAFQDFTITGASSAGIAVTEARAGLNVAFTGLDINLTDPGASGILAASSNANGYNLSVFGASNTLATTSATAPAMSIEAAPSLGQPTLAMQFANVSSGVAAGTGNAILLGGGSSGVLNITGAFTVDTAGVPTKGNATDVTNAGGGTVILPP